MISLTDEVAYAAMEGMGYSGALPSKTVQWLQANGATSDILDQAWAEMLASRGYSYPRPYSWSLLLKAQGHEGSLQEMEKAFWEAGGTFA